MTLPANICWSWRLLQHNFSLTILRLPKRLEDVFKTYLQDVFKTCLEDVLKTYLEDVLKTCLKHVLKILWRQAKYLLGISVYLSGDNKSKGVSNKSVFHKSISDNSNGNPKCINYNSLNSLFALFWNSSSISILRIKISHDWFGVIKLENSNYKIRHSRKGKAIKTNF